MSKELDIHTKYGLLLDAVHELWFLAEDTSFQNALMRNRRMRKILIRTDIQRLLKEDHPNSEKSWIVYFSDCCPECLDYKECVKSWKDAHILEFVGCAHRKPGDASKPTSKDVVS